MFPLDNNHVHTVPPELSYPANDIPMLQQLQRHTGIKRQLVTEHINNGIFLSGISSVNRSGEEIPLNGINESPEQSDIQD